MSDTCKLFPPFGDPWPSCLLPSQSLRVGHDWATYTFHFHALEKEMATHSSVLAWRIPGTGEPGGLPSLGLHRVGLDWCDLAAAAAVIPWSRKRQPTPVSLPGEFHRQGNLAGCSLWGSKELDTTELLTLSPLSYNSIPPFGGEDKCSWFKAVLLFKLILGLNPSLSN